jgi:hypothetical protein
VRVQPDDFSDMEAVATVRITGGNFRLIHRLCTQIECILRMSEIRMVTKEVVEAAREQLVIKTDIVKQKEGIRWCSARHP